MASRLVAIPTCGHPRHDERARAGGASRDDARHLHDARAASATRFLTSGLRVRAAARIRPQAPPARRAVSRRGGPRGVSRPAAPSWPERRAVTEIPAGLAGAAVAERLVARGWRIDLIERHPAACHGSLGASGGGFPIRSSHVTTACSRGFTRAGFLYALDRWREPEAAGHRFDWGAAAACCSSRGARRKKRA